MIYIETKYEKQVIICMYFSRINDTDKVDSTPSSSFVFFVFEIDTINTYQYDICFHPSLYRLIQILENVIVISIILLSLTGIYYFICMYTYRFSSSASFRSPSLNIK